MTTNQTIDGVPRRICHACVSYPRDTYCPVCDPATQPQGVPEIPKHLNYATVLVLQEGESEYGEALYGRDGEFRFGYDESALTDVEKWMPLPRREAPAPESINHGACVQEYPMKELVALPNDSDTNIPFIGLMPKGSTKVRYGKTVGCPNCADSKTTILGQDAFGVLKGPCPYCLQKPPPAGSDRISMAGAMIHGNGGPNPITYTGNGAIVNLDGYDLYAPGAAPVAVVMPECKPQRITDDYARGWNACLDEVTRLNTKE